MKDFLIHLAAIIGLLLYLGGLVTTIVCVANAGGVIPIIASIIVALFSVPTAIAIFKFLFK